MFPLSVQKTCDKFFKENSLACPYNFNKVPCLKKGQCFINAVYGVRTWI